MSNHKFDKVQENNKRNGNKDEDDNTPSTVTTKTETSFAQSSKGKDATCYCCEKKGHMVPNCPEKDTKGRKKIGR